MCFAKNVISVELPYMGLTSFFIYVFIFPFVHWDSCVSPVILEPWFEMHHLRHAAENYTNSLDTLLSHLYREI